MLWLVTAFNVLEKLLSTKDWRYSCLWKFQKEDSFLRRVKYIPKDDCSILLNISIKQPLPQCSLGTVTLEVGRIKACPFHSERRPSQSSQVGSCGFHQGDAFHMQRELRDGPDWVCAGWCTQAWRLTVYQSTNVQSLRWGRAGDESGQVSKVQLLSRL